MMKWTDADNDRLSELIDRRLCDMTDDEGHELYALLARSSSHKAEAALDRGDVMRWLGERIAATSQTPSESERP